MRILKIHRLMPIPKGINEATKNMKPFLSGLMKTLVASFLIWGLPRLSLADQPAPLVDSITTSPNGRFDFVMLGVENIPPETFLHGGIQMDQNLRDRYPSTGLYLHESNIPLWTANINAFNVIVADDGHHLARIGPWPLKEDYEELAVDFFEDGKMIRSYSVRDLVGNKDWCLPKSWSHYRWLQNILRSRDQLNKTADPEKVSLKTLLGQTFEFDLSSGEMRESTPKNQEITCNPDSPQDRIRRRKVQEEANKTPLPEPIDPSDHERYTNFWALLIFIIGIPIVLAHSWHSHGKDEHDSEPNDHDEKH